MAQFSKNTEACFVLLIIHSCQPDLGLPAATPLHSGWHGKSRELGSTRVGVEPGDGNKARQTKEVGVKQGVFLIMYMESKLQNVGNKLKRALMRQSDRCKRKKVLALNYV